MDIERYLAELPHGLDSYPEATCKASVIRAFLREGDLEVLRPRLPAPVVELLERLPPPSVWVPEVHANCVFLAQRATMQDDDAYVDHARERNRALLDSRLYRALFRVLSHRTVARLTSRAWPQLHRGSLMILRAPEPGLLEGKLSYPHALFPPLILRCVLTSLPVALSLGGAREVSTELLEVGPLEARFIGRWR